MKTEMHDYSYSSEYNALDRFIEKLDLDNITLICQDWGGLLGLPHAANNQERYSRLVPMNTGLPDGSQHMPDDWLQFRDFVENTDDLPISFLIDAACMTDLSDGVKNAYDAPFPDPSYQAGAKAMPIRVPTDPEDDGAEQIGEAREILSEWRKPCYVLFSDSDPITKPSRADLRNLIPTAKDQPDRWIEGAGHFLQEDKGEVISEEIVEFVERT